MVKVLFNMIEEQGVKDLITQVDSCGTGAYHEGSEPDSRTMNTLKRNGMTLEHKARQLSRSDFADFDYILAMDRANLQDIQSLLPPSSTAVVRMFGDFGSGKLDKVIKDPYYGSNNDGFDKAYTQCTDFSQGLIKHIQKESMSK